jgi:predicted MPP superfamily phosphohydrolase
VRAKDGVFSVLGNHDYSEYHRWPSKQEQAEAVEMLKRRQRDMGWRLLLNENEPIARGVDTISIIGVENISGDRHFRTYGDLAQAMQGADGAYKILLSHDPSHWRKEVVGKSDIDLMLAGHTHAMQVMFFGWSPSSLIYDEWGGLYSEGEQSLYVNRGLGQTVFKARIGAMPEITLLELKHK